MYYRFNYINIVVATYSTWYSLKQRELADRNTCTCQSRLPHHTNNYVKKYHREIKQGEQELTGPIVIKRFRIHEKDTNVLGKYTNAAKGILDFCKQKLTAPHMAMF